MTNKWAARVVFAFAAGVITTVSTMPAAFSVSFAKSTITTFDVPNADSTEAVSINADGVIVGTYHDFTNTPHAFIRTADGTITTFDPAGAIQSYAEDINDTGVTAGAYEDSSGVEHSVPRMDQY